MSALLRARLLLQQHSQHASGALLRFRAPLCSTARLQSETHNSNKDQQRGTQEKFGFITSPGTLRQAAEHLLSKEQVPPQAFFYALMNCQNRNLNCSAAGRTQLAELMWTKANQNKDFKPQADHYFALLRAYLMNRQVPAINALMAEMKSHGVEPTVSILQLSCELYAKLGDIKATTEAIAAIPAEKRLDQGQLVYRCLATAYAENGDLRFSIRMLKELQEKEVLPSLEVFNQVLFLCSKHGATDEAAEVFGMMRQARVRPTAETLAWFCHTFAAQGNLDLLSEAMQLRESMGIGHTTAAEQQFVRAALSGDTAAMQAAFSDVVERGKPPSDFCLSVILSALQARGDGVRAYVVWKFLQGHDVELRMHTRTQLLQAMARGGDVDNALRFLGSISSEEWTRDIELFHIPLKALVGCNLTDFEIAQKISQIRRMIVKEHMKFMRPTLVAMLKVWASRGHNRPANMQHITDILVQMEKSGFSEDQDTYILQLQALAGSVVPDKIERMKQKLEEMTGKGINMHIGVYKAFLLAYALDGNMDKVEETLAQVRADPFMAASHHGVYTPVLMALAEKSVPEALAYLQKLHHDQVVNMHPQLYVPLLQRCAQTGDSASALAVAAHLREAGVQMNQAVANSLLETFSRAGDIDGVLTLLNSVESCNFNGSTGTIVLTALPKTTSVADYQRVIDNLEAKHLEITRKAWAAVGTAHALSNFDKAQVDRAVVLPAGVHFADRKQKTSQKHDDNDPMHQLRMAMHKGNYDRAISLLSAFPNTVSPDGGEGGAQEEAGRVPEDMSTQQSRARSYILIGASNNSVAEGISVARKLVNAGFGSKGEIFDRLFRFQLRRSTSDPKGTARPALEVLECAEKEGVLSEIHNLNIEGLLNVVEQDSSIPAEEKLQHMLRVLRLMHTNGVAVSSFFKNFVGLWQALALETQGKDVIQTVQQVLAKADVPLTSALARELCRAASTAGHAEAAKALLQHVTEYDDQLQRVLFAFVKASGNVTFALQRLHDLQGAAPSENQSNNLVYALLRSAAEEDKLQQLRTAVNSGVLQLTPLNVQSIVRELFKTKNKEFVRFVLSNIDLSQQTADSLGLILTFSAYDKDLTTGRKALEALKAQTDTLTIDTLLDALWLEASGDDETFVALLDSLKERKDELTEKHRTRLGSTLMTKYGSSQELASIVGKEVADELANEVILIGHACRRNDLATAEKLYEQSQEKGIPCPERTYTALINTAVQNGDIAKAEYFLAELNKQELDRKEDFYVDNVLMKGYLKAQMKDKFQAIMSKYENQKTMVLYNTYLAVVDEALARQEDPLPTIQRGVDNGVISQVHACNLVEHSLESFIRKKDLDRAASLAKHGSFLRTRGISLVLEALADAGRVADVEALHAIYTKHAHGTTQPERKERLNVLRVRAFARSNKDEAQVGQLINAIVNDTPMTPHFVVRALTEWKNAERTMSSLESVLSKVTIPDQ
eukprot:m.34427 g.34427  ORF g.34427 m.34427 type:complete len:1466 (+) comp13056_c0_seq1:39-4436(+)